MWRYVIELIGGILLILLGIFMYRNPEKCWELDIRERLHTKGGSPSDYYISTIKFVGIIGMVIGSIFILVAIFGFIR